MTTKRERGDSNEVKARQMFQRKGARDAKKSDWSPSVFVPDVLTPAQKETIKSLPGDFPALEKPLTDMLESGYAFKFRWDDYNKCFAVWVSTTSEQSPNWGLILTGRGSTALKALRQALFLHFEVWVEEWAATYTPEEMDD